MKNLLPLKVAHTATEASAHAGHQPVVTEDRGSAAAAAGAGAAKGTGGLAAGKPTQGPGVEAGNETTAAAEAGAANATAG